MNSQDRLTRALAASAPPARAPAFTLAVIQAAETERFRAAAFRSVLRAAGLAAAAAALAVPLLGWVGENAEALQTGFLGSAALLTLVLGARLMSQRVTAAWAR